MVLYGMSSTIKIKKDIVCIKIKKDIVCIHRNEQVFLSFMNMCVYIYMYIFIYVAPLSEVCL